MGFSILQIKCRIMEDSEIEAQAPIIFGQDLISTYGILNCIIKPDKYCAVQPPAVSERTPALMFRRQNVVLV